MSGDFNTPPNPHYGEGKFIRSLAIRRLSSSRYAFAMEDPFHAFDVTFEHDGHKVTSLVSQWHRQPLSNCGGASEALGELVGAPLSNDIYTAGECFDRRQQCTHQFDMFSVALVHAYREYEDRRYDVIVEDARDGRVRPRLYLNNQQVLELQLEDHHLIVAPSRYRGVSLMRGFTAWANENLALEEREHAFIVQKAMFVAAGRRLDVVAMAGQRAALSGPPAGSCYASGSSSYASAVRRVDIRDFSDSPVTEVLKFFAPEGSS